MKVMDFSGVIGGEGVSGLTVTGSQRWIESCASDWIPVRVKGVSFSAAGSHCPKVVLGGGLYYDVGPG